MTQSVPESASFALQRGELHCEGVALSEIAAAHGTPAFVYSGATIDAAVSAVTASLPEPHLVAYAVKANGNLSILRRLRERGCGFDIVSGGELQRVLRAGAAADRVVFSGVGKTDDELRAALSAGVRAIHVESAPELDAIEAIASELGRVAVPISLRINPDIDVQTHPYIATGLHATKFGLEIAAARALLPRIVASPRLRLRGVACHIGSHLSTAAPLAEAVAVTTRFAVECAAAGAPITTIDAGGGWPIAYGDEPRELPSWKAYGDAIASAVAANAGRCRFEIVVEPGRALVGDAGALLTRVIFVKEQAGKRFVIVDAAMSELIRPALYGAYHAIVPVRDRGGAIEAADVVGPICETGDFFARDRLLPRVERGDLLLIRGAGAYGMSMANNYNARPLPVEVMVDGDRSRVIRRRQRVDELWQGESE